MAIELASAYVSVVPSFRGGAQALTKGMDGPLDAEGRRAGQRFGSGFAASIGPALKGVAAVAGAAFAIDFVGDSISAASSLEESISKNTVVFGEASESVLAFADNSATAFGQSKRQALEATGVFGNLLRSVGLSGEASAQMSTDLTALASDLASFNNVSVDEALDALRSGLVGETEPLKRFGVNLNEARLKQEALELGIGDGKKALDANAKALAANRAILEDTALAQGDFARTSGGLANQQRILSAQFDDAKAKIGAALLPALTAVASFITEDLIPAFSEVGDFIADNKELFIALGIGITAALVPAFLAWAGAAAAAAAATLTAAAPIIAIGAAIAALAAGVIYAYQHWDFFRNAVDTVARFVKDKLLPALQAIGSFVVDTLVPAIAGFVTTVADFATDVIGTFDNIVTFVTELPGRIADAAEGMWDGITDAFFAAVNFIIEGWNSLDFEIPGFDPPGPGPKFGGFTLGLPDIPLLHRASGGPVHPDQMYVVGENGPELFLPLSTGTIIPEIPAATPQQALVGGDLVVQVMPGDDPVMAAMRELKRVQLLAA